MRAMQEGIKNRYLPNTLQAQLEEQLLKNKYYPENSEAQNRSKNAYADYVAQQARFYGPNINSEMALRGMQGQHFGAQNNLLGAQANELNFENDRRKQIIENARQRSEIEAGQYNQPSSQDANLEAFLRSKSDVSKTFQLDVAKNGDPVQNWPDRIVVIPAKNGKIVSTHELLTLWIVWHLSLQLT